MTAATIVYILIVTLPLIGAAILTERACRLWTLPIRGVWAVTALFLVAIGGRPVARRVLPAPQTSVVVPIRATNVPAAAHAHHVNAITLLAGRLVSLPGAAARYAAHSIPANYDRVLAILWAAMSIAVLALLCCVYARVWLAQRLWGTSEFAGERVRVAPHAGPAVVGVFRPEIVIPRWALTSEPDVGRLIIMHETEHRNARDPLLLTAMWMFVTLFPWHPGAWYCLARTRIAMELDCDARVIGRGASLGTYAQLLVNQARAHLGAPTQLWIGATSLLDSPSHLERRLNAMLLPNESSQTPRPVARYLRTLSCFAIVSTIAIAACESHVPTAADITGLDAAGAERNARQTSMIDAHPVAYYVNGTQVSADTARAIGAGNISSISVVKRNEASNQQEIRITTIGGPITGDSAHALKMGRVTLAPGSAAMVRPYGAPSSSEFRVTVRPHAAHPIEPAAVVIDGVPSTADAMNALNPSDIASVDVIKGPLAMKESTDPLAKNGLIRITLKH